MTEKAGRCCSQLREELGQRNHVWALGRAHVESYGSSPVIVYSPDDLEDAEPSLPGTVRHGNFFDAAYTAICANPQWMRRFDKIHAQGKSLPRAESGRRWRELDSSMSSDALLMNIFSAPGIADSTLVRRTLGIEGDDLPQFGWKARVPLANGRFDRTEVDMRWGGLLIEAKLTETDFQSRAASAVEAYRDFDAVFERELLSRVALRSARRKPAVEFPEMFSQDEFSQEEIPLTKQTAAALLQTEAVAREYQAGIALEAWESAPVTAGYASYQLIRNVLAAHAESASFCVLHDARRPDLREAWFAVMTAVKSTELRVRLKVLTWQELAQKLPADLQQFLGLKYGIVATEEHR